MAAVKEIQRRYKKILLQLYKFLNENKIVANADFEFRNDTSKLKEFQRWVDDIIQKEIFDGVNASTADRLWLNKYIGDSYTKGIKDVQQTFEQMKNKKRKNLFPLPTFQNPSIFTHPAHVARAELIYTRVFDDLNGVTKTMSTQMSRILSDGMLRGESPKKVARALADRVEKIGISRSRLIARTEMINAHQQAALQEGKNISEQFGEEGAYEWIAVLDDRVREEHADRNGKLYSYEAVQRLLGEPNCRCAISFVVKEQFDGRKINT